MSKLVLAGLASLAIGATALAMPAAAQSKCALYGGEATMLTEDLAKFMANAALKNSITGANAKASGAVKMDCKASPLSTYCKATQKACK